MGCPVFTKQELYITKICPSHPMRTDRQTGKHDKASSRFSTNLLQKRLK